ncbi:hypothetical protein LTR85_006823 [Meristemomyces frigidus]|nr:hypothetical protein LTR85_006823 [Meristemomyces frigidus]
MAPTSPKQRLRKRLEAIIAPRAASKKKLPFTEEELFVIALLSNDDPMTATSVLRWTFDSFQYCRELAFTVFDSSLYDAGSYEKRRTAQEFGERLRTVPEQFELPFTISGAPDQYHYSISAANGERLLARHSSMPHTKGSFPFFRLPAELRNAVYEMVFRYSDCSLQFYAGSRTATVIPEALQDAGGESQRPRTFTRYTKAIKDILSPLLVSRQFHREAKPFFYNVNHFSFATGYRGVALLKNTPEEHRNSLKHVTVRYDPWCPADEVRVASRLLGELKRLRRLEIHFDEEMWTSVVESDKRRKHSSAIGFPGVAGLAKIRGLDEVVFHGCPTIEAKLKDNMLKPKPVKKVGGGGGRKRKAAEGSGDAATKKIRTPRIKKAKAG